jgi:hypothetical protein
MRQSKVKIDKSFMSVGIHLIHCMQQHARTFAPYNWRSVLRVIAVSDVVITPVVMEMITRPTRTHTIAKTRAKYPLGDRSPYLQVDTHKS